MNRGATRTGVAQADSRSTASTAGCAARTSTATAQLMERSLSSKLGHLMMRHGSRHLSTFGVPKSFRGFKFQKGPPKLLAILREAARCLEKKTAPEGGGEVAALLGAKKRAAMYLNAAATRRFRLRNKKGRRAGCRPSVPVRRLA